MREIDVTTDAVWLAGDYTGANRPMVRATIQHPQMDLYDLTYNVYASLLFGKNVSQPKELPNVKSLKWSRGVDTDIATATMELYNTAPQPVGTTFVPQFGLDQPGYYSYLFANDASHALIGGGQDTEQRQWQSLLVPDNLVRTYEGYGFNAAVAPEDDTHLYQSGVWMIKDVEFTASGLITVTMEDLACILRDQICFYPVVPKNFYPLQFSSVAKTSGFTQGYTVTKLVDSGGNYDPSHPPPAGWTGPTRPPTNVAVDEGADKVHVTWDDVPPASVPSGYEITGYQVVIDNIRQPFITAVGHEGHTYDPISPMVNGNVYWVTVVAIYARIADGYEQISDHSAGVFARPHTSGFAGSCTNLAINDAPV